MREDSNNFGRFWNDTRMFLLGTRVSWVAISLGNILWTRKGFPPCRASPGRLSYWEEAEVKRQIDVLVELGKMRPSSSEYACRVALPVKKDGSRRFCGDY
jgi:hypothetical protein